MTSIYDRLSRCAELIQGAVAEMPDPFTSQDVVQWFERNYPGFSPKTVRHNLNLRCAAANHPAGAHWRDEERTVWRTGHGQFTRRRSGEAS